MKQSKSYWLIAVNWLLTIFSACAKQPCSLHLLPLPEVVSPPHVSLCGPMTFACCYTFWSLLVMPLGPYSESLFYLWYWKGHKIWWKNGSNQVSRSITGGKKSRWGNTNSTTYSKTTQIHWQSSSSPRGIFTIEMDVDKTAHNRPQYVVIVL